MNQNKQRLYMSDLEFKPIHKNFTSMSNNLIYQIHKNANSDITS